MKEPDQLFQDLYNALAALVSWARVGDITIAEWDTLLPCQRIIFAEMMSCSVGESFVNSVLVIQGHMRTHNAKLN